jgi:hypothetical protein
MQKLKLQMDALEVQSFATGDADAPVQAREAATWPAACDPFSAPPRCS